MNGEVDFAGEQRVLDFLDEETLAANLRQRGFRKLVAGRADDDDLALDAGRCTQLRCDGIGLKERELAAARADPENHVCLDGSGRSSSWSLNSRLTASV